MTDWGRAQGLGRLRKARSLATSGRFALAAGDRRAESILREAVEVYWSAMNWLEDAEEFDDAHREIHEAGRVLREEYSNGCRLGPRDDGSFAHTCPVFLSHKRFGMSPGFTGNAICSICYEDVSECLHIPGDTYDVVANRDPWCNVCGDKSCSVHELGVKYEAETGIVVTEAKLHEVSIVPRPAQPDARIREIPIDRAEVEASLGRLPQGAFLKCDKCLSGCDGFDRLEKIDP